ncbi:eCIS core domain-containing protein [Kribbella sp. DT2]|uniref:eCIS core domain-containing protein n=1 Tax=Kribbella sp. DT2 TaxID=3393427 RepID=UPI003CFA2DB5
MQVPRRRAWARLPQLVPVVDLRATPILITPRTGHRVAGTRDLLAPIAGRAGEGREVSGPGEVVTGTVTGLAKARPAPADLDLPMPYPADPDLATPVLATPVPSGPAPIMPVASAASDRNGHGALPPDGGPHGMPNLGLPVPAVVHDEMPSAPSAPAPGALPPAEPRRRPRPRPTSGDRPLLTTATPESVGAPVEPDTPFRSIGEFERLLAEYETNDAVGLAMLTGFSSVAAPPPAAAPPQVQQSPVLRPQRRSLAETRKRGLSPAQPSEPAAETTADLPPTDEDSPDGPADDDEPAAGGRDDSAASTDLPIESTASADLPIEDSPRLADQPRVQATADPTKPAEVSAPEPTDPGPPLRHPEQRHPEQRRSAEHAVPSEPDRRAAARPVTLRSGQEQPPSVETTYRVPPQTTAPAAPLLEFPAVSPEEAREDSDGPSLVYRSALIGTASPALLPQQETDHFTVRIPEEVVRVVGADLGSAVEDVPVRRGRVTGARAGALSARAFSADGVVHLPGEAGELSSPGVQALLAHELTHVMQQRVLGADLPPADSPRGQELEAAAVRAEAWFGEQPVSSAALIHRRPPAVERRDDETAGGQGRIQRAPFDLVPVATPVTETEIGAGEPSAGALGSELPAAPEVASWTSSPGPRSSSGSPSAVSEWRLHDSPVEPPASTDRAVLDRLDRLEGAVEHLRALDHDGDELVVRLDDPRTLSRLAERLYANLRHRLRGELLIDRERHGVLADSR